MNTERGSLTNSAQEKLVKHEKRCIQKVTLFCKALDIFSIRLPKKEINKIKILYQAACDHLKDDRDHRHSSSQQSSK